MLSQSPRILLTGSRGLVGTALRAVLRQAGVDVVELDLHAHGAAHGDVRDPVALRRVCDGCTGIVHLAAVSRVVWGEQDPERCWSTNVGGTRAVVEQALSRGSRPWVILTSSREVYGQPRGLPVAESAERRPINVYGRSKVEAERIIEAGRRQGLCAAILRLANVYGRTADHPDRVVPAFARAAVLGEPLSVQGSTNTFDFTHLDDTVQGIVWLIARLERGDPPPSPIHLLTGHPTTLGELARLAVELAGTGAPVREDPPRTFDVAEFFGDPSFAEEQLGWTPRIAIREGLRRLIRDFRLCAAHHEVNHP